MHKSTSQALQARQVQTLTLASEALLNVVSGRLWVTQSNDPCDHFLDPQQPLHLRPGRVVLQAEKDSAFLLEPTSNQATKKPCQLSPAGLVLNTGLIRRSRLWPFPRTLQSG